jgi:prepilin-type N-terminal cleavage/methylation domain-containing protein
MPVTSATGNQGFTLLELLVVLTILVLLAGAWSFAAPRVFPAQTLRNETQRLIGALRLARMTARVSGSPQRIDFSSATSGDPGKVVTYDIPRDVEIRLREKGAANDEKSLTFYPDGSSTGAVIDIRVASRLATLRIGSVTGNAEIAE